MEPEFEPALGVVPEVTWGMHRKRPGHQWCVMIWDPPGVICPPAEIRTDRPKVMAWLRSSGVPSMYPQGHQQGA